MAENIEKPTVIPESGIWPEGLYCYQNGDKMLGFDAVAHAGHLPGALDIYNRPWIQLANRTRYLLNLFTRYHTESGTHALTGSDFADDIVIPEEYLHLDYGTQELASELDELYTEIRRAIDGINGLGEGSESMLLSWLVQKLVPLMWYYSGAKYAFEEFTVSMTLQPAVAPVLKRCVTGDDSIDVADTTGLTPGDMFMMTNEAGDACKLVTVKEVLTNNRVLLTEDSTITLSNGYLRGTNVPTKYLTATASKDFHYISDVVSGFENDHGVFLHVRHTPGAGGTRTVRVFCRERWHAAEYQYTEVGTDYEEDLYVLPALPEGFRLNVQYTNLAQETGFTMLYMLSETAQDKLELVHRPTVLSVTPTEDAEGSYTVTGDYYGTMYGINQKCMEARVSPYRNFFGENEYATSNEAVQSMTIKPENERAVYVSIRYVDENGVPSRWSEPCNLHG